MTIASLIADNTIKTKAKVAQLGEWLLAGNMPMDELLAFAEKQPKTVKASCIEAIEYATKRKPQLADEPVLQFVILSLKEEEPRIKWESAKVIGNIAALFPSELSSAITHLLFNAKSEGTIVRWATAFALGEIVKLKLNYNASLLPKIEQLAEKEVDNGVKNKYLNALKKIKK